MEVPDIYIFHSSFLFAVLQWVIFSGVRRFLLLTNSSFTSENLSIFFFFAKPYSLQRVFLWLTFSCLLIIEEGTHLSEGRRKSPTPQLEGTWGQL